MKLIENLNKDGGFHNIPDSKADLEARIAALETRLSVVEHNLNIIVELLKHAKSQ
jgi:uncharacterized Rmd1/YagE family protein